MPIETCECCGRDLDWRWEEAFEKFGFNDGDGLVMTHSVADVLRGAGYTLDIRPWGLHNTVIVSIQCPTRGEIMPKSHPAITIGYDNPRRYLPEDIIDLLDDALS
ncbi:MAG: hypothetical protein KJ587_16765 [Alphaproteobacteria bacterium]|nr:hypothetical protein [Alphaproteobacteria bacterium]